MFFGPWLNQQRIVSKIENRVQTAVDAEQRRYAANRQQSPIDIGPGTVPRVVTYGQLLIWHSEDDFCADHVTWEANGVNLRPRQGHAASFSCADCSIHRNRRLGTAHLQQARRALTRCAARCVDLIIVRVVDDLPLRYELRSSFGELLQQYDCQGEVAAGKDPTPPLACDRVNLREIAFGEAGSADDNMGATVERGENVCLGAVRLRIFDEDIATIGETFAGRSENWAREARLGKHLAQAATRMGA